MTAEMTTPKFSLLEIEAALSELLTARAEADEIAEPAEREQALAAVDEALAEYVAREVQKADNIINFCRTLKRATDAAKEDRDYYARRAAFLERTLQRVKDLTHTAMEYVQKKRIDGRNGYLLLKGNGGLEPLAVDTELLPLEYYAITVRLPQPVYERLLYGEPLVETLSKEPDNRRIRTALAAGEGVPGAHLEPRGSHVEVR